MQGRKDSRRRISPRLRGRDDRPFHHPPRPAKLPPPTGSTLAVILDARMLTPWDLSLSDHDQTALLPLLGPVMTLRTP
jgi:hypothetical protein